MTTTWEEIPNSVWMYILQFFSLVDVAFLINTCQHFSFLRIQKHQHWPRFLVLEEHNNTDRESVSTLCRTLETIQEHKVPLHTIVCKGINFDSVMFNVIKRFSGTLRKLHIMNCHFFGDKNLQDEADQIQACHFFKAPFELTEFVTDVGIFSLLPSNCSVFIFPSSEIDFMTAAFEAAQQVGCKLKQYKIRSNASMAQALVDHSVPLTSLIIQSTTWFFDDLNNDPRHVDALVDCLLILVTYSYFSQLKLQHLEIDGGIARISTSDKNEEEEKLELVRQAKWHSLFYDFRSGFEFLTQVKFDGNQDRDHVDSHTNLEEQFIQFLLTLPRLTHLTLANIKGVSGLSSNIFAQDRLVLKQTRQHRIQAPLEVFVIEDTSLSVIVAQRIVDLFKSTLKKFVYDYQLIRRVRTASQCEICSDPIDMLIPFLNLPKLILDSNLVVAPKDLRIIAPYISNVLYVCAANITCTAIKDLRNMKCHTLVMLNINTTSTWWLTSLFETISNSKTLNKLVLKFSHVGLPNLLEHAAHKFYLATRHQKAKKQQCKLESLQNLCLSVPFQSNDAINSQVISGKELTSLIKICPNLRRLKFSQQQNYNHPEENRPLSWQYDDFEQLVNCLNEPLYRPKYLSKVTLEGTFSPSCLLLLYELEIDFVSVSYIRLSQGTPSVFLPERLPIKPHFLLVRCFYDSSLGNNPVNLETAEKSIVQLKRLLDTVDPNQLDIRALCVGHCDC
jgi:hypothetical protein